ncbi:unnamed protein product [Ixodes pacificus]
MSRARITFRTTFVLVTTVNILVIYSIGRFWMFAVGPYTSRHVSAVGHRLRTSGCTMPQFDPFDPSVSRYFRRARDKRCPGNPDFIYLREGIPLIKEEVLLLRDTRPEDMECFYREIYRNDTLDKPDEKYFYGRKVPLKFGERLNKEFMFVECSLKSNLAKVFHDQFLLNPILKENVELRCQGASKRASHNLSVLVLGLDSVSNLNFVRHLPQTGAYVRDELDAFELFGFNKVGDNSFPNQLPLITGMNAAEAYNACTDKFFDNINLIWKMYAERGYRTMFLEESPFYGLFNYFLNGFHEPPADYYPRPLIQAMDDSPRKRYAFDDVRCLGPHMPFEMLLDYLSRFTIRMKGRPFFSYAWISETAHDSFNAVGYADAPFLKHFRTLNDSGVLNHTVVVFLSDHGLRFGDVRSTFIGKYEDRQPFAFLIFPRWFLEAHPDVARNLRRNQRRLTTHFDVHATLLELLDFPQQQPPPRTKYGISLFHEVPETRTCAEASISHHWCTCQADADTDVTPAFAMSLGERLVDQINEWVRKEPRKCQPFHLVDLMDVTALQPTQEDKTSNVSHYWVTVRVSPGGGVFEATLRVDGRAENISVLDQVSRCNWYFGQSYCVADHWLEKFCYCRRTFGFFL